MDPLGIQDAVISLLTLMIREVVPRLFAWIRRKK